MGNRFGIFIVVAISITITVGWLWLKRQPIGASPGPMIEKAEQMEGPLPFERLELSDTEWKERLTPEQYHILREQGTERAYSGKYNAIKDPGTFVCAGCDLPLFTSDAKYDSKTGWPSFWKPIDPRHVEYTEDFLLIIPRTEIHCARCDGHLGHLFDDGPQPTGLRYCINSLALQFVPTTNNKTLQDVAR